MIHRASIAKAGFAMCCLLFALPLVWSVACGDSPFLQGDGDSQLPPADSENAGSADLTRAEPTPAATPVRPSQVWGYVPDFDRPIAWSSAEANRDALSGVALFQYYLDADGDLLEYTRLGRVPAWVNARGLGVVPMITNNVEGRWDRSVVRRVLSDPRRRAYHVDQIVKLASDGGYPGVELDYENLSISERELFSAFVEALATALHGRSKQLAVAVHPKVSEPGEWDGPQAQDWTRIGAAADRIIIMAYDYDIDRPGPIAPLAWTRAVLSFAISQIPPTKVIHGIPLYSYDWSSGASGVDRTYLQTLDSARRSGAEPRRDPVDHYLVLEYTDRGTRHEVWVADGETVAALVAVGREVGLAGYALWHLGAEDPSVWGWLRDITR